MKVRALPTCKKPVGDGANRTRSITFEYNEIAVLPLAARGTAIIPPVETGLAPSLAAGDAASRVPTETKYRLPAGYEGNSPRKNHASGIGSYKKILLETPCPGRNLPEDTCCFGLSGVTGLGRPQFHLGHNLGHNYE